MGFTRILSLLIIIITIMEIHSLPMLDKTNKPMKKVDCEENPNDEGCIVRDNVQKRKLKDAKKDLFVSRGWGAGGMPFNVLYLNPVYSSKAPMPEALALTNYQDIQPKAPQVRTRMPKNVKAKNMKAHSRSVIPQLFVSYGWGPLGKK